MRRTGRLAADRSAAAVVEFALIVPLLVLVLLLLVEIGALLTAQGLLESAALRGSRLGATGWAPTGTAREQYIRDYLADQAFGVLRPERLEVNAMAYSSFSDIGVAGKGVPGFGGSGDVVLYTVSYPWVPLSGETFGVLLRRMFGGPITLTASIAVRNEAW